MCWLLLGAYKMISGQKFHHLVQRSLDEHELTLRDLHAGRSESSVIVARLPLRRRLLWGGEDSVEILDSMFVSGVLFQREAGFPGTMSA